MKENNWYQYLAIFCIGIIIGVILTGFNEWITGTLILNPVRDNFRDKTLYYVDGRNNKAYLMKDNILYYIEE